ncbi:hypothetical protein XarbCFBP7408_09200 [Xanthomonas arboricola pv. guizotiae]|uniref:Uncharacterized protein n=1 Tax=Xanthomonas arboricola pv. guizotiae TaxID=487867 RepID=A0A2S7A544_9XANT|nr:hypothetical protein XarbCFBP7409_05500 [Xanthomonas arboricola pv. guizotiae]PPU24154.1 hypothetical protein XarbCFBP7408_09200 [Xanthomonas arboricola pv. guizotiae]
MLLFEGHTHPTSLTGPCPPTVAGPYAAWMPRKGLHGRTCGVSCDGGRARALQPVCRAAALQLIHLHFPSPSTQGTRQSRPRTVGLFSRDRMLESKAR